MRDPVICSPAKFCAFVGLALLVLLIFAGCASTPQTITIEKPVVIPGVPVFLPIPKEMFEGCVAPGPLGPTNGDLLLHDHQALAYASCLFDHLTAIQGLK